MKRWTWLFLGLLFIVTGCQPVPDRSEPESRQQLLTATSPPQRVTPTPSGVPISSPATDGPSTPSLAPTSTGISAAPIVASPTLFAYPTRPSLGDFLAQYNLPTAELSADTLAQRIISFDPLNSEQTFLIAYFVETGDESTFQPLYFLKLEKSTNTWTLTRLSEPARPVGEACHPSDCYSLGVVTDFLETDKYYFAYMHSNPSAGWTLVLTHDLELHDVLYGKVRQVFADGTAVYDESIIHFAPTHYALIDIYDPMSSESSRIFPREPYQPLWRERMELVAQAYNELGETWCQDHNHHCNPELFNNYLASEVVVNDDTDSLAFVISFGSELSLDLPGETRVVYVYRHARNTESLDYREVGEEELQQLFGDFELAQLLEAENLELIFRQFDHFEE